MKQLLVCAVIFLLVSVCRAQTPAGKIPGFTFLKVGGGHYSTSDIPLKPSLFVFFDVTCSHCQSSVRFFEHATQKLSQVTIHLISMDTMDAIEGFLKKNAPRLLKQSNVRVLQDLKYEFILLFKPVKYPSIFLYNRRKGLEIYTNEESKLHSVISRAQKLR